MRKRIKILLIIIVVSTIVVVSMTIYNKSKVQNIFDEIYYDSVGATGESFAKRTALENIEGMSSYTRNLSNENEIIIEKFYNKDILNSSLDYLGIINNNSRKTLSISFSHKISENVLMFIDSSYSVERKILSKTISFSEISSGKRISDDDDVATMLLELNVTSMQLDEWYELGMVKTFLTDWLSVFSSNYSLDNLGSIEIITKW